MKKITLFAAIAAAGVFGFAACQKAEAPAEMAPQEEEIQAQEPSVKAVAKMLNQVAEAPEVQDAVKKLVLDINKGSDWHHLTLAVSGTNADGKPVEYVSGEIGLIKGESRLLEIDLKLLVGGVIPLTGTLEPVGVSFYLSKALLAKTDEDCDKYLEKANKGINVSIMGIMTLALMRTQDAEGARKVDLFLLSNNPEDEPVALSSLLELLMPKE